MTTSKAKRGSPSDGSLKEKVEHVKKQRGPHRWHTCHWPGCSQQVHPSRWGCKTHWFKLPKVLRDKIWASYRIGQEETMRPSLAYIQAAKEVNEWIRTSCG